MIKEEVKIGKTVFLRKEKYQLNNNKLKLKRVYNVSLLLRS
jgi:hypothetical protein